MLNICTFKKIQSHTTQDYILQNGEQSVENKMKSKITFTFSFY